MNRPPTELDLIELGSRISSDPLPAPQVEPSSKSRPRNRRPLMRKLSRVIAATSAVVVLLSAAPAFADSHKGTTEADTIACAIPQPFGWAPMDTAKMAPVDARSYAAWVARDVRFRQWDQRYEVITRTDRGTAPFCVRVLDGVWVYSGDVRAVTAYLVSLNAR